MYVSDDEGEDDASISPPPDKMDETDIIMTSAPAEQDVPGQEKFITTNFSTHPHVIPLEEDPLLRESDQVLLMHEQLGHCSFSQLRQLTEKGIISWKLAKVPTPKCPSCLYGKAHQKPWQTHKIDPKIKQSTVPGAVVSVDQLESPISGFIPIVKGQPMTKHYRGATVFIDHTIDFTYVHLNQALTMEETLDTKHAFEQVANQHGVHIHCDNRHFADRTFIQDIQKACQTISFHGVGAHHQNGITERCIHDITESARMMLLHAAPRWPKTISAHLWPQALKHATNVQNTLPRNNRDASSISLFACTMIKPNVQHFHTFRCPIYVLQAPLQNQNPFPKWNECLQAGIFLCHSPHHAASVPLVLSTQTGLVSPQFHCVFNNTFNTIKNEKQDTSVWQRKVISNDKMRNLQM